MSVHRKHAKLEKPKGGLYHSNEWGFIGAPCGVIKKLSNALRSVLSKQLSVGWMDADHKASEANQTAQIIYTDKIALDSFELTRKQGQRQYRKFFNTLDLLLINGNHFSADKQIVFINEKKKESLERKKDRLTDVRIILLENSYDDIYPWLLENLDKDNPPQIFRVSEIANIARVILEDHSSEIAPLYGLILSGGKSQRMGQDKGALQYHGIEQREYEARLASQFCNQTFISCRMQQDELIESSFEKLYDRFDGLGPYGGILSAFQQHPNAAWLTLACDLPYLAKDSLALLVKGRNPSKLATCFYNPETEFPEPLITIWEPRAYPVLLEFLSQGFSCPRKVLINTDVEILEMPDIAQMKNANTDVDREEAMNYLKAKN